MQETFINIKLNNNTIQEYIVRTLLFNSLNKHLNKFSGELLDVGCGQMPYKNYILTHNSNVKTYVGIDLPSNDVRNTQIADKIWDGKKIPFEDNTFETIICTEVLEHCFEPDIILSEIFRVLKTGGIAYFTVPFVYALHETPYDYCRYTPFGLEYRLTRNKFYEVRILPLGGWEAVMGQLLALWYTKRRFKILKVSVTLFLIKKVISFLLKNDKPATTFSNNEMSLGLSAIASK